MMAGKRSRGGRWPRRCSRIAGDEPGTFGKLALPAVILGIVLIVVAVIYFVTAAHSLPSFFPGHVSASRRRSEPPPHQARHRRARRGARLLRVRVVPDRARSRLLGRARVLSSAYPPALGSAEPRTTSSVQTGAHRDAVDAERRQPVGLEEAQQELDREERRRGRAQARDERRAAHAVALGAEQFRELQGRRRRRSPASRAGS